MPNINSYMDFTMKEQLRNTENAGGEGIGLAIQSSSLTLAKQPIFNMESGLVAGYEYLLRVRLDNPFEDVSAEPLIKLAERNNGITFIDHYVASALSQIAEDNSLDFITFNLSPVSICDPLFAKSLISLFSSWEGPKIIIEVIESGRDLTPGEFNNFEINAKRLLRSNFHLAYDDFGCGNSPLRFLRLIKPEIIKLSRNVITESLKSDKAWRKSAASGTVDMAHNLGCLVIAEGVETIHDLEFVKSLGCDFAQGYFLGKPEKATNKAFTLDLSSASTLEDQVV